MQNISHVKYIESVENSYISKTNHKSPYKLLAASYHDNATIHSGTTLELGGGGAFKDTCCQMQPCTPCMPCFMTLWCHFPSKGLFYDALYALGNTFLLKGRYCVDSSIWRVTALHYERLCEALGTTVGFIVCLFFIDNFLQLEVLHLNVICLFLILFSSGYHVLILHSSPSVLCDYNVKDRTACCSFL